MSCRIFDSAGRTLRQGAVLVPVLVLVACGAADPPAVHCGEVAAPIFGGTADGGVINAIGAARGAIVQIESTGGTPLCTGTVIARGEVLTAAHCQRGQDVIVWSPLDDRRARSQRIDVHPELDAAVIELSTTSGPSPILPLSTAHVDASWIGQQVQMTGFGRTERGTLGELRFVREPIADVKPDEIWVDGDGVSGACEGDSGGPLIGADDAGHIGVLGVLSRGSRNCQGVDVYIRASALRSWTASLFDECMSP